MSTPKGMTNRTITLKNQDQVFVYHNAETIILQVRRQVATEENILHPSFKVAVELGPVEALALASELLTIAASRIPTVSPPAEE